MSAYFERFLAGMLSNVRPENARRRERLVAVDTFVRTFAAVHLHILSQHRHRHRHRHFFK